MAIQNDRDGNGSSETHMTDSPTHSTPSALDVARRRVSEAITEYDQCCGLSDQFPREVAAELRNAVDDLTRLERQEIERIKP